MSPSPCWLLALSAHGRLGFRVSAASFRGPFLDASSSQAVEQFRKEREEKVNSNLFCVNERFFRL